MSKKPVRPLGMVRCNSAVPFSNPYTERLSRENENRKLVQAIKSMRPQINNQAPQEYPHLSDNKKKLVLADERFAKIERENNILLERLCLIARPRPPGTRAKPTSVPGIALDVHLRPVIDNQESDARLPVQSLNAIQRKRELVRVMRDNQAILERIYKSKGVYSAEKWQADAAMQEKYLALRSRHNTLMADAAVSPSSTDPEVIYQTRPHTVHSSSPLKERSRHRTPGAPNSARGAAAPAPAAATAAAAAAAAARPTTTLPGKRRPVTAVE